MPYEEMEETEETEEVSESDSGKEEKDYTVEEMIEYMLNEVNSVDEAKSLLEEHGFELKKSGGSDDMDEMMPPMPMPMAMPKPKLSIVELRMGAAKKALGKKDKEKKED